MPSTHYNVIGRVVIGNVGVPVALGGEKNIFDRVRRKIGTRYLLACEGDSRSNLR